MLSVCGQRGVLEDQLSGLFVEGGQDFAVSCIGRGVHANMRDEATEANMTLILTLTLNTGCAVWHRGRFEFVFRLLS